LGLILYFHFGEEHRKKYKLVKKLYKGIQRDYSPGFHIEEAALFPHGYNKLINMLKNISDAQLLDGNQIDFYIDGEDKFRQFFMDIQNAENHVHILYYKIENDNLGRKFQELLIKKAKEGITVRLIYDDVGSLKTPKKYFDKMKKEGVEVEAYLPVKIPRIARTVNYRNHKKLAVIDGKIGYVGGMNIGDCYVEGVSWGTWRDMQIRIKGNGVKGLQKVFLMDWYASHKKLPQFAGLFPEMDKYGDNPMQIVSSGPVDIYNSIEKGIYQAINGAQKNIYIQTPYFIPSETVLSALITASISGIEVHIMIPRKSDNFFVDGATYSFVRDLLNYNIKVYLYQGGFIHTKCMTVDDSLTIVGSANMDMRSFELSFETDAFIYDEATAQKAKDIFLNDALDSYLVNKEEWKKRPRLRRFFESIMRIFTPLL
ncbi:MAG: cardiolipin synthase, partial [Bacteroidales bacterium]|nr:cardiolipin synthase [Bacteroidales bacterium]